MIQRQLQVERFAAAFCVYLTDFFCSAAGRWNFIRISQIFVVGAWDMLSLWKPIFAFFKRIVGWHDTEGFASLHPRLRATRSARAFDLSGRAAVKQVMISLSGSFCLG